MKEKKRKCREGNMVEKKDREGNMVALVEDVVLLEWFPFKHNKKECTTYAHTQNNTHLTSNRLAGDLLAEQAHLEAPPLHQALHLAVNLLGKLPGGCQQERADATGAGSFQARDGRDHTAVRE